MKINGKFEPGQLDNLTKPKGGSKTEGSTSITGSSQDSEVAKLSKQFGELSAPQAPFDTKKVAEIQQAIRNGTFEVNAEAVADGVIRSAREMLGDQ